MWKTSQIPSNRPRATGNGLPSKSRPGPSSEIRKLEDVIPQWSFPSYTEKMVETLAKELDMYGTVEELQDPTHRGSLLIHVLSELLPCPHEHAVELQRRLTFALPREVVRWFEQNARGAPPERVGNNGSCSVCASNFGGVWVSDHPHLLCPLNTLTLEQRREFIVLNLPAHCPFCGSRSVQHRTVQTTSGWNGCPAHRCALCQKHGHQASLAPCVDNLATSENEMLNTWHQWQKRHYSRVRLLAEAGLISYEFPNDYPKPEWCGADQPRGLTAYRDDWTRPEFPRIDTYRKRYSGLRRSDISRNECLPTIRLSEDDTAQFGRLIRELFRTMRWVKQPVERAIIRRERQKSEDERRVGEAGADGVSRRSQDDKEFVSDSSIAATGGTDTRLWPDENASSYAGDNWSDQEGARAEDARSQESGDELANGENENTEVEIARSELANLRARHE